MALACVSGLALLARAKALRFVSLALEPVSASRSAPVMFARRRAQARLGRVAFARARGLPLALLPLARAKTSRFVPLTLERAAASQVGPAVIELERGLALRFA
jgi:hypothetical protein